MAEVRGPQTLLIEDINKMVAKIYESVEATRKLNERWKRERDLENT